jgi:hypothetical protein
MICDSCCIAGELNSRGKVNDALDMHNGCKGCECQHKIGTGWFARKGEKASLHQTQSP